MDYRIKLQELVSMTPEQLWEMYPDRVASESKIMVEVEKIDTDVELVYNQFVSYLKIPKRKPWIVKKLIKEINQKLNLNGERLENIQSN